MVFRPSLTAAHHPLPPAGWSYQLRFCHKFYSGSDGARNQACLEGAQDFLVRHRLGANSLVAFYQAEDGRYVSKGQGL